MKSCLKEAGTSDGKCGELLLLLQNGDWNRKKDAIDKMKLLIWTRSYAKLQQIMLFGSKQSEKTILDFGVIIVHWEKMERRSTNDSFNCGQ